MMQCHWDSFNAFEHYGSGSFDMMGWDALNSGTLPLFHFEEFEANQSRDQLLDSMPVELYPWLQKAPLLWMRCTTSWLTGPPRDSMILITLFWNWLDKESSKYRFPRVSPFSESETAIPR